MTNSRCINVLHLTIAALLKMLKLLCGLSTGLSKYCLLTFKTNQKSLKCNFYAYILLLF